MVRAYARRRLALDTERGNAFTLAVVQSIRTLLGDEIEADLAKWIETRADAIRRPIKDRYSNLERELAEVMRLSAGRRSHITPLQSRLKRASLAITALGVATSLLGFIDQFLGFDSISLWRANIGVHQMKIFGGLAAEVGVLSYILARGSWLFSASLDANIEEAKLERRRKALEVELEKLELLRAASPEALLARN